MLDLLVLTNNPNVDASIKLFSRSVKYKFRIIRSYVQCNMFMYMYMIYMRHVHLGAHGGVHVDDGVHALHVDEQN